MDFYTLILFWFLWSVVNTSPLTPHIHSPTRINLTHNGLNGSANPTINCYTSSEEEFVASSCTSIFAQIRDFSHWISTQEFLTGVRPRAVDSDPDSTPPYFFIDQSGGCAMSLKARRADLADQFSWAQVSRLGRSIIRQCPSYGGWSYIGQERRWEVKISGTFRDASLVATKEGSRGTVTNSDRRSLPQEQPSLGSLSMPHSNVSAGSITCWQGREDINVPLCTNLFRTIADFRDYRTTQEFVEEVRPRLVDTDPNSSPPFLLQVHSGRDVCSLNLQSNGVPRVERFSWQQVVLASQAISVQCGSPGPGGWTLIGAEHKWFLSLSRHDLTSRLQ
ncbi:MAG: hypothetical protein Q9191_004098 [Dirinaria sp. TL-2023a]